MTSAPPTSTHLAQPSKSRCAASSVCPPSMNNSRNGVRQPRGDDDRLADHGDDVLVEFGGVQRAAQRRQRVEPSADRVDQ